MADPITALYVVTAATTYAGGRAAAKATAKQAAYERQRAKQEYLQHRQQGIAVLDEMLANASTLNAYAGAGGIDASSGSVDTIANFNLGQGVIDLVTSRQSGEFTLRGGELQSQQLMSQARATNLNAFAQSAGIIAAGASAGAFGGGDPTATTAAATGGGS